MKLIMLTSARTGFKVAVEISEIAQVWQNPDDHPHGPTQVINKSGNASIYVKESVEDVVSLAETGRLPEPRA